VSILRSLNQVFRDTSAIATRDFVHGRDQVLVEARVVAKAVFSREIAPTRIARSRNKLTLRLASKAARRFKNVHVKAALREFVRGAQPANPSADNDDVSAHKIPFKSSEHSSSNGILSTSIIGAAERHFTGVGLGPGVLECCEDAVLLACPVRRRA
jgi:hypothetical protein